VIGSITTPPPARSGDCRGRRPRRASPAARRGRAELLDDGGTAQAARSGTARAPTRDSRAARRRTTPRGARPARRRATRRAAVTLAEAVGTRP
jgi:hypothetical protein